MAHEFLLKLIHRIYATGDGEIDCQRMQSLLPAYVEAEVAGNDAAVRYPEVTAHLAQCPDCTDEHDGLRAVVALEAKGSLPEAAASLAQFEVEPAPESVDIDAIPAP